LLDDEEYFQGDLINTIDIKGDEIQVNASNAIEDNLNRFTRDNRHSDDTEDEDELQSNMTKTSDNSLYFDSKLVLAHK